MGGGKRPPAEAVEGAVPSILGVGSMSPGDQVGCRSTNLIGAMFPAEDAQRSRTPARIGYKGGAFSTLRPRRRSPGNHRGGGGRRVANAIPRFEKGHVRSLPRRF